MKRYRKFMDGVRASDTLNQRLKALKEPKQKPAWAKYSAMAAALILVFGLGAYGLNYLHTVVGQRLFMAAVEKERAAQPDIAPLGPGDAAEGEKTLGGYDVTGGGMTTHYILPYIEYGPVPGVSVDACLAPPDGGLRDVGRDDVLALIGNEDALAAHLNWGDLAFSGTVGFEADGTVWMMSLWGEGADVAFSLELSPDRLPPTDCVVEGEQRTVTDVWGVEVSGVNSAGAYGDTERGVYMDVSREVEFIANGVGCRLKVYGTRDGAVEELVSRFVRWAVLEGLDLSGISPDGAKPLDIDPNYSVGEPNWNDSAPAVSAEPSDSPRDRGENWCGTQGADTETCPNCGAAYPVGSEHECELCGDPPPHTCEICGEVYMEGTAHSHEICGYPLAPDAQVCEVCGQTIPVGVEHSHQEDHHGSHH